HFERSFLNHLGDWRHHVLARSQLNELQPDGDQNLKPYYCYWLFLAKCFVSYLVAEYWNYKHYTHFAQDIRHFNVNFHYLGRVSYVDSHFLDWASSSPYRQQHESQSFLEFNSENFIYTWCFGSVDRENSSCDINME
ncbi:hypothetical protein LZ31DRAFT_472354, partial [Colletotrichum somersetense]